MSYVIPPVSVLTDAASLWFLAYHPMKQAKSLNLPKIRKVKDFGVKTDILGHNPVKIGQKVKDFGVILLSVIF